EMDHRGVLQGILRGRQGRAAGAAELLSLYRAVGRVGSALRPFGGGTDHVRPGQCLAGARRLWDGQSQGARDVRHRSRDLPGFRLRRRHRSPRHAEIRRARHPFLLRIGSALASALRLCRARHADPRRRAQPMKFTLSWLKARLDTEADVQTIADKLTSIGLEVESIEDACARLKDFTVAEIVSAEKHPNADKLRLCMVNAGDAAPLQIVCGAPNARAGIKVVLARPGTVIPVTGEALKIGTIRGVESRGMMCSARELLLGEDHDGIIELPADARVGARAADALGLTDPVIEINLTPNRGDCAAVHGVARDLAAAGVGRLRESDLSPVPGKFPSPIGTAVESQAAPMFAVRLIRGVKNGPSPQWLQDWLKAVGLRPISALVDVTNFLSLDRGRPLHVFDAGKIKGNLRARLARDGEQLLALDGKTYTLDAEMVVIADDAGVQGIGGVMGGEDSSCTESTTDVFVESALFDPISIARTGRRLGIRSDARYRFERGVDPEFTVPGLELATRLILDWCGGEPSDISVAGAVPAWRRTIPFDPAYVARLAGLDVPKPETVAILK